MLHIPRPSEEALQEILRDILAEADVPGIGAAIGLHGEIFALAAGVSTLETKAPLAAASRFEMSCLMKFFVSLVTLDLAVAGKLNLDASIEEFLPEFEGISRGILLRHLLSHSSGYRGLDITDMKTRWSYSWNKFTKHFVESPLHFLPGSTFNYEHSEHVMLGEILRRITGQTARDLVQRRIFAPLHIETGNARSDRDDPAHFVASHGFSAAGGNFAPVSLPPFGIFWDASLPDSSIALRDIARIAASLMSADGVFSPSVLAHLPSPLIAIPRGVHSGRQSERIPQSFGLGCAQYGEGLLGHNGSMLGQTCALRFDPEKGMAIVVGVNARSTFARDTALQRLWAAIMGKSTPERSPDGAFHLETVLNGFTPGQISGQYAGSYLGEVSVKAETDGIGFDVGPPGNRRTSFRILPDTDNDSGTYRIESRSPVSVTFIPDPETHGPSLFLGVHSYKKIP